MPRAYLTLLITLGFALTAAPEMIRHPVRGDAPRHVPGHPVRAARRDSVDRVNVTAPSKVVAATGTLQLRASVEPADAGQTVTWISGDTTRATVSASGLVTGVRTGAVTVTARSRVDPAKTGALELTVKCPRPRTVDRPQREDATWKNWIVDKDCTEYVVAKSLEVRNGVLTVQPGTRVAFQSDVALLVTRSGGLSAVGTAEAPIVFTGTEKVRGYWRGIAFTESHHLANRLDHVTIEYGGGHRSSVSQAADLAITHSSSTGRSRVGVTNSTLRESAGYGLYIRGEDAVAGFAENVLTRNASGPAYVAASAAGGFQDGNDFTGNDADYVSVPAGGGINNIRADATWRNTGVPYRVLAGAPNEVTVEQRAVLRIDPGVDIRFGAGVGMSILQGSFLVARGTAQDPVVLQGDDTQWRGIKVHDGSAFLEHVRIEDAGSARWSGARQPGAVTVQASNGGTGRVTFASDVMNGDATYGIVFTSGNTFASGCLPKIFVPPADAVADHCNDKGTVKPPPPGTPPQPLPGGDPGS